MLRPGGHRERQAARHSRANGRANINKELRRDVTITRRSRSTRSARSRPAPAPQNVTYTYLRAQRQHPRSTRPRRSNVSSTDNKCPSPTYVARRHERRRQAQDGETWTPSTCTMTHPAPGTYTNVADGLRREHLLRRAMPVSQPARQLDRDVLAAPPLSAHARRWTPRARLPPGPPRPGALRVAAGESPCMLPRAAHDRARTAQLNTIQVEARTEAGAGRQAPRADHAARRQGRVGAHEASGVATLRVRPSRSGRAAIRAGTCTSRARSVIRWRGAVGPQSLPRVTG